MIQRPGEPRNSLFFTTSYCWPNLEDICDIQKMLSIANQKNIPLLNGQRGLNKNQCMDCLQKKVAIVERWPLWRGSRLQLVEVGLFSNQYKTVYHWFDVILLSGLKVKMFLKRKRKRKRNRNQYVLCRSLLYWIVLSSYSTLSCDSWTLNPSSSSL